MVAEPRTHVDEEAAVRAWAREALPALEGRVFFGYSDKAARDQVTVTKVAGSGLEAVIQFDVWGPTKAVAARLAAQLKTAAEAIGRYRFDPEDEQEPSVLLHGCSVEDRGWQPDETSGEPRYVVEATFTVTAAQ